MIFKRNINWRVFFSFSFFLALNIYLSLAAVEYYTITLYYRSSCQLLWLKQAYEKILTSRWTAHGSLFFLLVDYAYTLVKFEMRKEKRYRNSQSIEYSTWRIQAMSAKHNLSNRSGELRSSHNQLYCCFVLDKTSLNHFDYIVDGLHSFVVHIIRRGLNTE